MYERCSMGTCADGVKYNVVEWVKKKKLTLWCGGLVTLREKRLKTEEFMKKKHTNKIMDRRKRGRPFVRWKNMVKEFID